MSNSVNEKKDSRIYGDLVYPKLMIVIAVIHVQACTLIHICNHLFWPKAGGPAGLRGRWPGEKTLPDRLLGRCGPYFYGASCPVLSHRPVTSQPCRRCHVFLMTHRFFSFISFSCSSSLSGDKTPDTSVEKFRPNCHREEREVGRRKSRD